MATGNPPFANEDPRRAIFLIPRTKPAKLEGKYSASLKEFLGLCLREEPDDRPTSEELLKTKFIKNSSKGTSILLDLIARHENWKLTKNDESDDELLKLEDDETESEVNDEEDDEWVFETIKSMSNNRTNKEEETDDDNNDMPSRIHGRSKSIFDQMELSEADGTVREKKNKYKEDEDEITKAVIEKMKLDKSWYNSKGIDTSSMANEKYKDILNSIPLKGNNQSGNDINNIQSSLENLNISDNNSNNNNNNANIKDNTNNNSLDHEENCKTISGNNNNKVESSKLMDFNLNDQKSPLGEDNNSFDETDDNFDSDDEDEDEDDTFEIPNKGVAIKKLTINPAMLDQDTYSNTQCYSPVYSIKSYTSNALPDNTIKSLSNNNINKGKITMDKSPQFTVIDPINKPQMGHKVKQPSISSVQSPYTPLLSLNSPINIPYSANSSSSSPMSNENTPKVVDPIQITQTTTTTTTTITTTNNNNNNNNNNNININNNIINNNNNNNNNINININNNNNNNNNYNNYNNNGSKAHSVQSSPFLTNVPPQHSILAKTSISAPSTTTSTPTTINVKKNLQSPSVLFQNKNNKLANGSSNINVHSHVGNNKKKSALNQFSVILNTRNSNIRKKTVDNHSTPIKGMIRKLSLNPIDKHNLKDSSVRPVSPYKTHFYSISCPQNNNYKKSFVNIKELFEKASTASPFDNNNDKSSIRLRKPGSFSFLGSNNKRPVTVNNLHLYEKDALEREINEVINETIQCLDAYHALFSDVMIPTHEKRESRE
eukprot:jgi/Orpsp1_1/1187755/evm.model.d7180000059929.1